MLTIVIGQDEFYNEETEEFETRGGLVLELEHSLVSLSKWEAIHEKPFLGKESKTADEIESYIECMILTPNFPPGVVSYMTSEDHAVITRYIESSKTATTFYEEGKKGGPTEVITSELIYYWMVTFNIPFETQTWHLNRLFALIRICNVKSQPPKKRSRQEIAMRNRQLNEQRRATLGTRG